MKKTPLIIAFLAIFVVHSYSQKPWIDFGLKGMAGTTWLFNSNISGDRNFEHTLSPGFGVGGKLGINYNNEFQLTVDAIYAFSNQSYAVKDTANSWTKTTSYTSLNIPVLLRLNLSGTFIELGPQFSMIQTATEKNSGDFQSESDVLSSFEASYVSGVFGIGRWVGTGIDNFNLAIGLRFTYGFSDVISSAGGQGSTNHYPVNDLNYPDPGYGQYAGTNPFAAMLILEFNYDLASVMDNTCHRTTGR